MSSLNIDCPNCECEDAYHNGVEFECPNCDYTWGALEESDFDDDLTESDE